MCDDHVIRRIAGVFIIVSVALGFLLSPGFFYFTAFVGFNLLQSGFTGFCPLEKILSRLGLFGCHVETEAHK